MVHGLPQHNSMVVDGFGRILWENPIYGDAKLKKARDCFTLGSGSTAMGNGEHATTFFMSEFWDRLQWSNCDDKGTSRLAMFCNRIRDDTDDAYIFSGV